MTTTDLCYKRILNFHQGGGESLLAENGNKIGIVFQRGGTYLDNSILTGQITNLDLDSVSVFQPACFEADCFVGSGIWTTAAISNKSRVVNNVTEYWIEGTLDIDGNLWVLDLGYISPTTGRFVIEDFSVPITKSGNFESRIPLSRYTKLAVLKKVTYSEATSILHYFGSYLNNQKISRSRVGYLLNYNAEDQKTYLEDLSIGLLSLIFSQYKPNRKGEKSYFIKGEMDFYLNQIIEDNLTAIARLIDNFSSSRRFNSLPKVLTTYLTPEALYNDELYSSNIARCFEPFCFDDECFEVTEVNVTSSREVSTRAVAWFYILIYTYTVYINPNKYSYLLNVLAFYLLNQIDYSYKLPSEGWTHTDILSESEEILEYNLSTATVTYIALLKHYEYTSKALYLETAVDIQEGIKEHLYNFKSKLYKGSDSLEETSYALLYSLISNKTDVVESLIEYLNNLPTLDYGINRESILNNNILITNNLSQQSIVANSRNLNFVRLATPNTTPSEISKINLILYFSLSLADYKDYFIPVSLEDSMSSFRETIEEVEESMNILSSSFCLTNINPLNLEPIVDSYYSETLRISSERAFILNKLKSFIPLDFGWFSEKALSFGGNLFSLLKSFSGILATSTTYSEDVINNNYISSSKQQRLNLIASDYGVSRIPQEFDDELKKYIIDTLSGKEDQITERGILRKLSRYGILSSLSENYKNIFVLNTLNLRFSQILGKGYIQGNNNISTNIVEILCQQPINSLIIEEIKKSLPISVKPFVSELVSFEESYVDSESCVQDSLATVVNTNYILQENSNYIKQENNDKISLEN